MPGVADHNVYCNVNCNGWKEKICLESILVRMNTFIDSAKRLPQCKDLYESIQSSNRPPNPFHLHVGIVSVYIKARQIQVGLCWQSFDQITRLHCLLGPEKHLIDLSTEAPQPQPVPLGLWVRYPEEGLMG